MFCPLSTGLAREAWVSSRRPRSRRGPPAGCPWGEVASGLPTRSLPLSESQHPWGLGPRWTVSVLGPTAQCLRARSGLRRSSGSPDRRAPRGPAASFHTSFPSRPGCARPRVLCRVHVCAPCASPFFPLGPVPGQRVRSPHSPERCRPRASEAACSLSDPGGSSGLPGPHVQFYPHRLRENECHPLLDHRTGEASLVLVWGKGIFAIELTFAKLQELDQSVWFGTKLATGPAGRDLLGGGSPQAEFSCGLRPA